MSAKISIWVALDDATPENGCLRLIPGSQRQVVEMKEGRAPLPCPICGTQPFNRGAVART